MKSIKAGYSRALDVRHGRVDMTHGAGGRASAQLIRELFVSAFDNPALAAGNDGAVLPRPGGRIVMATDAHVISPLFFPGGDIGSLAVHGTVNDLAMCGATPCHLAASFILEEGFALSELKRIADSMARAARASNVPIVTGDTKVVERGHGDGVFITTTGIGVLADGIDIAGGNARPGDAILLSGPIGNHGVAILSLRESLSFETEIVSDSAALDGMVRAMLASGRTPAVLRDPTRGGLASALNEIAAQSAVGMLLDEQAIPVEPEVRAACELLGLDPLYVANEGRLVCICRAQDADGLLSAMRAHPLGSGAARIGEVQHDDRHFVQMRSSLGGRRIVDWLTGEQLPRIC